MTEPAHTIEQALARHRDAIMALPNVVGMGLGRCGEELCIRVLVTKQCRDLERQVDELLGPHRHVIELTDPIRPLAN